MIVGGLKLATAALLAMLSMRQWQPSTRFSPTTSILPFDLMSLLDAPTNELKFTGLDHALIGDIGEIEHIHGNREAHHRAFFRPQGDSLESLQLLYRADQ